MKKGNINVYLNKDERKKIDDLKAKYRLSLTTMCDILTFCTLKAFISAGIHNRLINEYLRKNEKGTKTSIKKPKNMTTLIELAGWEDKINYSRLFTNALKIYLYKEIDLYIEDPKVRQEYWNSINQKFTTTKDDFYDYNNFIRYQRRNLRENKDYYKKEIDKMEHRTQE